MGAASQFSPFQRFSHEDTSQGPASATCASGPQPHCKCERLSTSWSNFEKLATLPVCINPVRPGPRNRHPKYSDSTRSSQAMLLRARRTQQPEASSSRYCRNPQTALTPSLNFEFRALGRPGIRLNLRKSGIAALSRSPISSTPAETALQTGRRSGPRQMAGLHKCSAGAGACPADPQVLPAIRSSLPRRPSRPRRSYPAMNNGRWRPPGAPRCLSIYTPPGVRRERGEDGRARARTSRNGSVRDGRIANAAH